MILEYVGTEPTRAHPTDAGYDLRTKVTRQIPLDDRATIYTGTSVAIPEGHVGLIMDRSSMAARGLHVLGGVIDSGYRGEIAVMLVNLNYDEPFQQLDAGDRIAQLVIVPVATPPTVRVESLPGADRGDNGFGSTGR